LAEFVSLTIFNDPWFKLLLEKLEEKNETIIYTDIRRSKEMMKAKIGINEIENRLRKIDEINKIDKI
jgi:hypothetical protein